MCGDWMIYTDKYEGHTPADEWRLVFTEVNDCYNKEMLGLTVRAYHLGQMQACDPEDYLVAQANQDLARDAPLLLAEVKELRMWKKTLMSQLTNAKQVMNLAVRGTLDTFGTCPSCDSLTDTIEDFIPEGLRSKMLLDRQNPTSIYFVGEEE